MLGKDLSKIDRGAKAALAAITARSARETAFEATVAAFIQKFVP